MPPDLRDAAGRAGRRPAPAISPSEPARRSVAGGLVRGLRPRQWVKNFLVFAAPLAAGAVLDPDVLGPSALAFVLFCAASSAVYLVNDAVDVEDDRRHPVKRLRPIAAGIVPRRLAVAVAAVLFAVALVPAALYARPELVWVLVTYVGLQLAYCLGLKNQPVLDLAVVASGFLLRGIAGGVAAGLLLSQWFLLVAAF